MPRTGQNHSFWRSRSALDTVSIREGVIAPGVCDWLPSLGSIKAPRLVVYVGYDARHWTSASAGAFAKATLAPKERALE